VVGSGLCVDTGAAIHLYVDSDDSGSSLSDDAALSLICHIVGTTCYVNYFTRTEGVGAAHLNTLSPSG
jgi:hypothetical protein